MSDLDRINNLVETAYRQREAIAPDDVCRNCGSRIFQFTPDTWTHRNGSVWCEPQIAVPMGDHVVVTRPPAFDADITDERDEADE